MPREQSQDWTNTDSRQSLTSHCQRVAYGSAALPADWVLQLTAELLYHWTVILKGGQLELIVEVSFTNKLTSEG